MERSAVELDHISVPVRRYREARRFYEAALGAVGMRVNMEVDHACGLGANGEKIFWLVRDRSASGRGHYALRVAQRELVDAFYEAALEAGGTDHGAPGPRPDYGPNYYAAFVKDREGNNIEVVCYAPARRRPAPARPRAKRASATTSRPTTSPSTTSPSTTSRPTTSRPTTSRPTTPRPTASRATTSPSTTSRSAREPSTPGRSRTPEHLRAARSCYDHMAGALGVALHDRLVAMRWLARANGDEYEITHDGREALAQLGVNLEAARRARRRFAYGCVDWSERRPHVAGALGAALLASALERGWVEREPDSRALRVTRTGARALRERFGIAT